MGEPLSTGQISPAQRKLIERRLCAGDSFEAIRKRVCELGHVANDDLRDEVDSVSHTLELRRELKKEGARLMREFVNRVKSGTDVDDMAAMLEIAIYRDLLRRYMESEKALESVKLEELLKLDIQYRRVRLASRREMATGKNAEAAKKLAARMLPRIVNKLVSLGGADMADAINGLVPELMEWARGELGREQIEEMEKEGNELEQLRAAIEQEGSRGDSQAKAGHEKAYGLAE